MQEIEISDSEIIDISVDDKDEELAKKIIEKVRNKTFQETESSEEQKKEKPYRNEENSSQESQVYVPTKNKYKYMSKKAGKFDMPKRKRGRPKKEVQNDTSSE